MSVRPDTGLQQLLALRRGTFSVDLDGGGCHLVAGHHAQTFPDLSRGEVEVLRRLAKEYLTVADVRRLCADLDAVDRADRGTEFLDLLRDGGWLKVGVSRHDSMQYALEPLLAPPPRREPPADLTLSRFAVIHRDGDELLLESPLAWCDVRLFDPAAVGLVAGLGTGSGGPPGGTDALGRSLRSDLWWSGLLVEPDGSEASALSSRQWSPHELWFHEHSRGGHRAYTNHGFGGTRWADGTFAPLPARREPRFGGPRIALGHADLHALSRTDPTLTTVIEGRSSIREHDDGNPLTLDELGQFLYRTARTRAVGTYRGVEYKNRPYPSGGSAYELEIYPVVRHVTGLAPGMYHYDAEDHELVLVAADGPPTRRILRRARMSSQQPAVPQVVLVIAARFGRLMWTYEAMAYALVLKHVGVLYQTMYLVATAMGLAACGLGSGDNVHFAAATGMDAMVEDNVGEFMLGRPRATLAMAAR
jgi:SagB-type dehydrogenase family enzyme